MKYFISFFSSKSWNPCAFYTCSSSQFRLSVFQFLNSHMWLVTTILGSEGLWNKIAWFLISAGRPLISLWAGNQSDSLKSKASFTITTNTNKYSILGIWKGKFQVCMWVWVHPSICAKNPKDRWWTILPPQQKHNHEPAILHLHPGHWGLSWKKNHITLNIGTTANSGLQTSTGNSYHPKILINSLSHCPQQLFHIFIIFLKSAACAFHLLLSFFSWTTLIFHHRKMEVSQKNSISLNLFPPSDFNLYPSFFASCPSPVPVTSHLFQDLLHQWYHTLDILPFFSASCFSSPYKHIQISIVLKVTFIQLLLLFSFSLSFLSNLPPLFH